MAHDTLCFLLLCSFYHFSLGMFRNIGDKWFENVDTNQKNYGVAICDVDNDGRFEIIVAGFSAPNLVLKYDRIMNMFYNIAVRDSPYEPLMDSLGAALGVCCCDIDGDGREEIFFVNTNNAYAGLTSYRDKLFKWNGHKYVDLFSNSVNSHLQDKTYSGRSAACLDRYGRGKYGIVVATYASKQEGKFVLYEMNEFHPANDIDAGAIVLQDSAKEAGIDKSTGGRGIFVGPVVSDDGKLDVFFCNEGNSWLENLGHNFLFKNLGNGTFVDVAEQLKITDEHNAGRGTFGADFNHDGLVDFVVGNYEGPHRLYIQHRYNNGTVAFINVTTPEFEKPCMVRTVIVDDFDNDGALEVFFNNMRERHEVHANRLFTVRQSGYKGIKIRPISPGDATDADGYGTGGAILDVEGDGMLELVLSHGEDVAQPLDIFTAIKNANNWLRILPRTKYGAPARGATVTLVTSHGDTQMRIIDSGSGYLCQMEPVAHFGLGSDTATEVTVRWSDGKTFFMTISLQDQRKTLEIYHPDFYLLEAAKKSTSLLLHPVVSNHTEL